MVPTFTSVDQYSISAMTAAINASSRIDDQSESLEKDKADILD